MIKLFIDTSTGLLGLGLKVDGEIKGQVSLNARKNTAEQILPLINKLLDKEGLKFAQIDEIYLTPGPGSYTGERIGLTIAKTFAVLKPAVKIYLITSLKVLSLAAKENVSACLLDARNNAYFAGFYQGGNLLEKEGRIESIELETFMREHPDAKVVISSGQVDQLKNQLLAFDVIVGNIIELMMNNESAFDLVENPIAMKPVYLRGHNA
ncbi:MAG: tRNA (adenosine(37)-N6)-threonylcarbamoyltransferase complex dimerization subunit type 1 TsaB [Bacilli bacterium]